MNYTDFSSVMDSTHLPQAVALDFLGNTYYPISIIYLVLSCAAIICGQKLSSLKSVIGAPRLPDILHRQSWSWLHRYHYLNNWVIYGEIFLLIADNVRPFTLSNSIATIYLFFRLPSFYMTTLPRPSYEAKKQDYINTPTWKLVMRHFLLIDRNPGYDNDFPCLRHPN